MGQGVQEFVDSQNTLAIYNERMFLNVFLIPSGTFRHPSVSVK